MLKTATVALCLLSVNLFSCLLFGLDKLLALLHRRRIPEATLLTLSFLGGSVGAMLGMSLFRHKTRHWSFKFGMPAILVVQILLALAVSWGSTFVR